MTAIVFIDQLRQLGLSSGEARVYISLLGLYAPSKVGLIVKESHVSYSKVYDVLRRLTEKGLVSHDNILRRYTRNTFGSKIDIGRAEDANKEVLICIINITKPAIIPKLLRCVCSF